MNRNGFESDEQEDYYLEQRRREEAEEEEEKERLARLEYEQANATLDLDCGCKMVKGILKPTIECKYRCTPQSHLSEGFLIGEVYRTREDCVEYTTAPDLTLAAVDDYAHSLGIKVPTPPSNGENDRLRDQNARLLAMLKEAREAFAQLPDDALGVAGGEHEGATAWFIKHELESNMSNLIAEIEGKADDTADV